MFVNILFLLAVITGEEAAAKRRFFWTFSVLSTAFQAAAIMTLIPLLEGLFSATPQTALPWLGLMVALLAITWFIDVISFKIGFELGCYIVKNVKTRGIATISHLDLADLHSEKASKLAKLISTASSESLSSVIHLLFPLSQALLLTPLLSVLLLFVSWKLSLAAFITGLLLLVALLGAHRFGSHAEEKYADAIRELNDASFEFAWAQPTLRTAGISRTALDNVLQASYRRGLRLLLWQIPGETIFSIVLQLGLIALATITGMAYINGEISGVTAAALIVVLLRIIDAAGSLSLLATPLSSTSRIFKQISELDSAAAVPTSHAPIEVSNHDITLDKLTYHYPGSTAGINDIDLHLKSGSITVIVGESGSGKSTLLDVLSGLREYSTGTISFGDTIPDAAQRLALTSVMFQTTELRQGSLADNVPVATAEQRAEIAEIAQLSQVIDRLPNGWQTPVGEGGGSLSGGERQRVGLARALAKPAQLLLVDEATAALDPTNEQAIVKALATLRGSRTLVIVTHRPALVQIADQIVVLHNGRIVETGTLDDLRHSNGVFATMWQRWQDVEHWTV